MSRLFLRVVLLAYWGTGHVLSLLFRYPSGTPPEQVRSASGELKKPSLTA